MTTATTTPTAVRDAIVAVIAGLTPTTAAGDRFIAHREETPVRDFAAANPGACFRRCSVRWVGPVTPPTVTNTDVELVERSLDVDVAYPASWRGGGDQLATLDDVIAEDLRVIANAVGTNGRANLTALPAGSVTVITSAEEPIGLGPIWIGRVSLIARYYRSNA